VDGGIWQNSGATVSGLPLDIHTVSFSAIRGWTTPANQTISISANSTITDSGSYVDQFTYTTNAGTLTIFTYTGPGGTVTIPSMINGMAVTGIGEYAFADITGLTNITIPASVISISQEAFAGCTSLTSVYFQGNAPTAGLPVFSGDGSTTAYYLPGSSGWFSTFCGVPAVLWNPLIQTSGTNFGVKTNQFGFNITGTAGIPIVVEACANLANSVWTPLQILTLTNGSFYFSDPQWTNYPGRFYRISSP
jgi:hypothetical protein